MQETSEPPRQQSQVTPHHDDVVGTADQHTWVTQPATTNAPPNKPATTSALPPPLAIWGLFLPIAVTTIIVLAIAIHIFFNRSSDVVIEGSQSCETEACQVYAAILKKSIDFKLSPCDDFYRYVCYGWDSTKEISVYWSHILGYLDRLTSALEAPVPRQNQNAVEKAASFFQSCLNAATAPHPGEIEDLRRIWHDCGILWPRASNEPDVLRSTYLMFKAFHVENVLNIVRSRITFRPHIFPGLHILIMYRKLLNIKLAGTYRKYYETFVNLFRTENTTDDEVLSFDISSDYDNIVYNNLANGTLFVTRAVEMPILEVSRLVPAIPVGRWRHFFSDVMRVSSDTPIEVASTDYLIVFNEVLAKLGERELHRYLGWFAIQVMAPYLGYDFILNYAGSKDYVNITATYQCLARSEFYFGWAVFEEYAAHEMNVTARKDIHSIVRSISTAITRKIVDQEPIFERNPEAASDIINALHFTMKFYDWTSAPGDMEAVFQRWPDMNEGFLRNWFKAAQALAGTSWSAHTPVWTSFTRQAADTSFYVFLNGLTDQYLIPPYVTMLPLYDLGLMSAAKYGGLGGLVATAAVQYMRGRYATFRERRWACVVAASDKAYLEIVDAFASMMIAWEAFTDAFSVDDGATSPMLLALPQQQVFFISMCYLMCGQQRKELYAKKCNEPLKHSVAFSKAFSCSNDSAMNPERKCSLF
ncbi:neprilysin-1-like [Ornithodoros turicata]|uniref:neprilysin-1-like n=1 Tax=Ornithodoros turicata TaxID=34597 RepID=UPI0031397796